MSDRLGQRRKQNLRTVNPHKNFAYATVATAPSPASSGTSLVLTAGHGARMPAVPFEGTVCPIGSTPDPTNAEIVRVDLVSTDTLTIVRAREGTSARTIVAGDQFFASITVKDLDEPTVRDAQTEDIFVPAGKTLLVGRGLTLDGTLKVDGEALTT